MNLQEIESVWAQQPAPPAVDLSALQQSLKSQLGRRQRVLIYAGVSALIGLVAMQAIFVIEMRSPQPENPWLSLGRLLLHQGISLVLLAELVRVFLRHRRLAGGRAASVREVVSLSLAGVEAEMTDYRLGRWMLLVLTGHSLLSVYLNQVVRREAWDEFGVRVAMLFAVYGLFGLLGWWHYRRVLRPRREKLRETLEQLEN
jgi:hypothetical protein